MNEITPSSSPMSMSSREIAELTGATHDNVLKSVRLLIKGGVVFGNETPYVHPQNRQTYSEILLDYRNTMVVVSGYSPKLRAKIIDRWMELEGQAAKAFAVPQTKAEALRLAADLSEQVERQQAEIAVKDATIGRISAAPDDMGIRDAGRALEVGQDRVKDFLIRKDWACIQGGKPRPAHYGLTMGYTRLVERIYPDRFTGEDRIAKDFKITQKGITRMSELLAQGKFFS